MREIFIDISNLYAVCFITGIQRVVINVARELIKSEGYALHLIVYNRQQKTFRFIRNDAFLDYYFGVRKDSTDDDKRIMMTSRMMKPEEMPSGCIFFDLDSAWNASLKRDVLYPILNKRGVKIVTYIYDVLPIKFPFLFTGSTLNNYMQYFSVVLKHADYIIASTKTVLNEVDELCDRIGVKRISHGYSWLGSDFMAVHGQPDKKLEKLMSGRKYVACIGTVEPRKNHSFILDAFDNGLFEKGMDFVIAGRKGWNNDKLLERIEKHKEYGKHLFFFEGLNDSDINYLYENAKAIAIASLGEGFGLPIIESYEHETPVLCSDIPVFREVGADLAEYFSLDDVGGFVKVASRYLDDEYCNSRKMMIKKEYKRFTWTDTTDRIKTCFDDIYKNHLETKDEFRQMVILTARSDDIARTLAYIDAFMPFIEEVVLCCPDFARQEMESCYSGRLTIKTLTDSQLLDGRKLPQDHAVRNFFLRTCIMKSKAIDDVFIMSDDDYRPLKSIDKSFFYKDGKYQAYYCYDLEKWKGTPGAMTSFDLSMFKTRDFLLEHNFPTLQFSSHMPQVIDKRVYNEMLEYFGDIEETGLEEWGTYFNYLIKKYPESVDVRPYVTMMWPGSFTNWPLYVEPSEYLFENFYDFSYEGTGLLNGFHKTFIGKDEVLKENEEKKNIVLANKRVYERKDVFYRDFCHMYKIENKEVPNICIGRAGSEKGAASLEVITPKYLEVPTNYAVSLPIINKLYRDLSESDHIEIVVAINRGVDALDKPIETSGNTMVSSVRFLSPSQAGEASLFVKVRVNDEESDVVKIPLLVTEI